MGHLNDDADQLHQAQRVDQRFNEWAAGILPTGSSVILNPERVTDGGVGGAAWAELAPGPQWLQLDLTEPRRITGFWLVHRFDDGRTYHDVVVQFSDSVDFSSGVTTLFNNDTDNSLELGAGADAEYAESASGLVRFFPAITARYARFWSNGNSKDSSNHYVEIQLYEDKSVYVIPQEGRDACTHSFVQARLVDYKEIEGFGVFPVYAKVSECCQPRDSGVITFQEKTCHPPFGLTRELEVLLSNRDHCPLPFCDPPPVLTYSGGVWTGKAPMCGGDLEMEFRCRSQPPLGEGKYRLDFKGDCHEPSFLTTSAAACNFPATFDFGELTTACCGLSGGQVGVVIRSRCNRRFLMRQVGTVNGVKLFAKTPADCPEIDCPDVCCPNIKDWPTQLNITMANCPERIIPIYGGATNRNCEMVWESSTDSTSGGCQCDFSPPDKATGLLWCPFPQGGGDGDYRYHVSIRCSILSVPGCAFLGGFYSILSLCKGCTDRVSHCRIAESNPPLYTSSCDPFEMWFTGIGGLWKVSF